MLIEAPKLKEYDFLSKMPQYEVIMIELIYQSYCTTFIAYEFMARMKRAENIDRLKFMLN